MIIIVIIVQVFSVGTSNVIFDGIHDNENRAYNPPSELPTSAKVTSILICSTPNALPLSLRHFPEKFGG